MSLENLISNIKKGAKSIAIPFLLGSILSCSNPTSPSEQTPINPPSGYDYTTTTKIVASKNISNKGGLLEVTDSDSFLYNSKIIIPDGALDSNKNISIAEVNNPPALPDRLGYVGSAMDLEPDEINFNIPTTVVIPYDDGSLSDAGISDDSNLQLYSYNKNSNNWTKINNFSLDTNNNTITAEINHFSYYAITCLNAISPEDLGTPRPGDLLYTLGAFWNEGHPLFFNNWMPGHVGIYTGEKTYPGTGLASDDVKEFGIYNVIEALPDGVQYSYYNLPNITEPFESSLKTFNGGNLYMGAREPKNFTLTSQQRLDIILYAEAQVGKPYALEQTIGSAFGMLPGSEVKGENEKNAYNCVGLAEKAYEKAGVNNGEGIVSEEQEEWILTPAEQYNATKPSGMFNIRDRGPAGGWIFYDKGNYSDGWRYLEAAPQDQTPAIWGTHGLVTGVDKKLIGTGKQNTLDILRIDPTPNKAADKCADYSVVINKIVYDDWFFPSINEVNQMDINLSDYGIGNFVVSPTDYYWSSSECLVNGPGEEAYASCFNAGLYRNRHKNNFNHVRAVRSF